MFKLFYHFSCKILRENKVSLIKGGQLILEKLLKIYFTTNYPKNLTCSMHSYDAFTTRDNVSRSTNILSWYNVPHLISWTFLLRNFMLASMRSKNVKKILVGSIKEHLLLLNRECCKKRVKIFSFLLRKLQNAHKFYFIVLKRSILNLFKGRHNISVTFIQF